ncbi:MAG TPA: inositol monophosphatase family protein [Solirubrobacteraceae bacterium]|nr:inositol monophosphatase family protein [Solirubrobacteraceae bacterium]
MPGASDDLALALELADVADAITMARFRAEDLVVETKPDLTPVSEADRAVEQALREHLASRRPQDTVFGEEYGGAEATDETGPHPPRRWIVDPIDGTKGYVRGMPVWATLLALEENGEMVLGVASAPSMGRRWWAARGAGAFTSDVPGGEPRRLRVSGIRVLEDAQMCFGGFEEWRQTGRLDVLLALSETCWRTRGYGDFWQYMLVAEGAAEIALDPAAALWDLAAPMAIVQEAGGRFTDLAGSATAAGGHGIGSNGLVHEAARQILAA